MCQRMQRSDGSGLRVSRRAMTQAVSGGKSGVCEASMSRISMRKACERAQARLLRGAAMVLMRHHACTEVRETNASAELP